VISFQSVSKVYPDGTPAVQDLTIEIPTGKITVFVGPSGCGKTTSLRMINRTIERTSGTISIDGEDINAKDAVTLRRGIGYVIQNAGLFPHKTVVDNIATVPKLLGWDKRKAHSTAMELLERVGLDLKMAERYPAQLSGGQQQRVGVARALAADPAIMLMDEPFSAVDPIVRHQLQEELLRLQRDIGKTIVFVTHDIDEAIKLGDNVAVLQVGGKLAQFAPPAELLANPVDDFVRGFVGQDRGYRALTFVHPDELPLKPVPEELALKDGVPVGWRNGSEQLLPVGALYQRGDSLRAALDAVLTSPTGRGICVDADGKAIGVIDQTTVAEALRS
jgi:osmoprotectant transport system ATP-binding protein